MKGQGRSPTSWVLGITLPLTALLLALFADLALHHGHRGSSGRDRDCQRPRPAEPAQIEVVPLTPRAETLDEALLQLELKCRNWSEVSACVPDQFATTMAGALPVFEANRDALERRWLAQLAAGDVPGPGDHVAAYGLAWLRSERALPVLRHRFLADHHWEFLEWGNPDDPEVRYADKQYPHHLAFAAAIQHIAGRPYREVVKLSRAERRTLRLDTRGCDWSALTAHWLLHKLDGVPLPSVRWNTAWRYRCEPNWPGP